LGSLLVAVGERGVCAITLGDNPEALAADLLDRFPEGQRVLDDPEVGQALAQLVSFIEAPTLGLELRLDVRCTAFQQRVWQALREIPMGAKASYAEIARRVGSPKAVRAVAGACAANSLALAIPCHRVVRSDGSLSGYRWGMARKAELLRRESIASLPREPEEA